MHGGLPLTIGATAFTPLQPINSCLIFRGGTTLGARTGKEEEGADTQKQRKGVAKIKIILTDTFSF